MSSAMDGKKNIYISYLINSEKTLIVPSRNMADLHFTLGPFSFLLRNKFVRIKVLKQLGFSFMYFI